MRRLTSIAAIAGLLAVSAVDAQAFRGAPRPHRSGISVALTAGFDAATTAVFNAMGALGPQPSTARKALYSTMIQCAETKGFYANLDWWNVEAADGGNSNIAVVDLANPAKHLTIVGPGSFSTGLGWTGDGSTARLDYGESLAASGNHFSINSATLGVWFHGTPSANSYFIGTATSSNNQLTYINGGSLQARIGGSTASNSVGYTGQHHIAIRRVDNANIAFFADGFLLNANIANAVTDGSVSASNGSVGTARGIYTSATTVIAMSYSGNMTAQNIADMDTCARPFLNTVGAD